MNVLWKARRIDHRVAIAILCAGLGILLWTPTMLAQDASVADETCLDCHEDHDRGLSRTAHRLTTDGTSARIEITCAGCHPGGGVHSEDPSPDNITNPATASEQQVLALCQTCHTPHLELDNIGFDPHLTQDLSCVSCHSVHGGNESLLLDDTNEFCASCHTGVLQRWNRTSVHPLLDGQIRCLSCHDFTGNKAPDLGHGQNQNCLECHMNVSGPFLWEHEATSSFTPDGGGCVACHAPHGSANERLLTRPGDALCRDCHVVPLLHRTQHEGVGTQFLCIECHSDVHGSDHNHAFLDPDLSSRIGGSPEGCYCHGLDR